MKNYRYVSFLCSDDYQAIIKLRNNLEKVKSRYGFLCVVTEDLSDEVLIKLTEKNVEWLKVPLIDMPVTAKKMNELRGLGIWNKVMAKINIFNLTQFDKVIYLDYDLVILRNVDELFDYPHLSAVEDVTWFHPKFYSENNEFYRWTAINTGVVVIEPNPEEFKGLVDFIPTYHKLYPTSILSDQSLVDKFYDWKNKDRRLPLNYNVFASLQSLFYVYGARDPAILHFAGGVPKPHTLTEDTLLLHKAYGKYFEMTKGQ